jgi:hypothetical protein
VQQDNCGSKLGCNNCPWHSDETTLTMSETLYGKDEVEDTHYRFKPLGGGHGPHGPIAGANIDAAFLHPRRAC